MKLSNPISNRAWGLTLPPAKISLTTIFIVVTMAGYSEENLKSPDALKMHLEYCVHI